MGVQALGSKNGGHSLHEKPARPVQWRKAHHQRMPIKLEQTVKFIGVIFDKALTWAPYLDHVVARCNNRLNLLKVTAGSRWGASKDVLLIVYKPLIRSLIDYGCIAYDTAFQTLKSKLESIQSKALRICCGAMVGTPTAALQVECGQPPLALRRHRMMADYALKVKSITGSSVCPNSWRLLAISLRQLPSGSGSVRSQSKHHPERDHDWRRSFSTADRSSMGKVIAGRQFKILTASQN